MSPRSAEQFDEIRLQSRAKIMTAALELFGKYGYHSTSIAKIAKAASISKGLMYNYFDSKEDLLHTIILEDLEKNEGWWNEIIAMDAAAYEKIKQIIERTIEVVREDLRHWQLLTSLIFQPETMKGLEDVFAAKQIEIMSQIVTLFTELGVENPMKEAFFYGAFLDGMFLHYMQMEDQYPLDDMKDYFLKRYEGYL